MIVTIDGPAGSGKSTVARRLAERLGMRYLDTGALYRAVTWLALERGVDVDDDGAVAALARENPPAFEADGAVVKIAGHDVSTAIRGERVSAAVPAVARLASVRTVLSQLQRELSEGLDVIAEGRDMGTVVFPAAELKFFLDAAPGERNRRRYEEIVGRGERVSLEDLSQAMHRRDQSDRDRAVAPLRKAEGAVALDTTAMSLDEVVETLAGHIAKR